MRYLLLATLLGLQTGVPSEVEKAQETLDQKPDHQQSNLIVGKYHLEQGEVEKAIPFLLKGADSGLKAAAASEEGVSDKQGIALLPVAEAWLKVTARGSLRQACVDRASHWFGRAWPDLDSAGRGRLQQRLGTLYAGPRVPPKPQFMKNWNGPGRAVADRVHTGSYAYFVIPIGPDPNFKKARGVLNSREVFVDAGKPCVFSCWVLTEGTDSPDDFVRMSVGIRDFTRAPVFHELKVPRDLPVWTKLSVSFTPEVESLVLVSLNCASTRGKVFVDDVSVRMDGKELFKNGGFEE